MAFLKVENVAIRGISACVPPKVEENRDIPFYAPGEAEQIIAATGIERRHIAGADICVSDLCFRAAERLIDELGWDKDSIWHYVHRTQTTAINQPLSWFMSD